MCIYTCEGVRCVKRGYTCVGEAKCYVVEPLQHLVVMKLCHVQFRYFQNAESYEDGTI